MVVMVGFHSLLKLRKSLLRAGKVTTLKRAAESLQRTVLTASLTVAALGLASFHPVTLKLGKGLLRIGKIP